MTKVSLQYITKHYPGSTSATIENLSLTVPSGQITALLGASGSGKTTLLKIIAGLTSITHGDVWFNNQRVTHIVTEKRGAVMVFQNHLLFPHLTIAQNIGFGLKMRGEKAQVIRQRTAEMLDLIQLPNVAKRRPHQLSGGQQQRVALARALIVEPNVLLLDEPLSNLDTHLRDDMRALIRQVQQKFEMTTVIVTHDRQDAVVLADCIALMRVGKIEQFDTPDALFQRPVNIQTARFFGGCNFVDGDYDGAFVHTPIGAFQMDASPLSGAVTLTIRPEHLQITHQATQNTVSGTLVSRQFMGEYWQVHVQIAEHQLILHTAHVPTTDTLQLYLPPQHIWLLPR